MKKLKTTLTTICLILLLSVCGGCDKGSVFNSEQMTTDATTRIASAGLDLRVYEFTPKTAPEMTCVFVAGSSKGGLTCFDKLGK